MRKTIILAALGGLTLLASPAGATASADDGQRDQDRAYDATQSGQSMPLPMIERRVVPRMGGSQYLGPEFRGNVYRLKFLKGGRVIWVDVNAKTGRIVGRSGR
ncbi:PepSY domain-containing protein [Sphingomicrobium nitratireducens]|uniref:PepSY domain-containing protein n=1 Tax=Sphingomicrobium nitratireducens TaxID=2964666 RepID=UPI00224002E9|nr:hypothetical protein [Sphingomicrobium nitratireducens]